MNELVYASTPLTYIEPIRFVSRTHVLHMHVAVRNIFIFVFYAISFSYLLCSIISTSRSIFCLPLPIHLLPSVNQCYQLFTVYIPSSCILTLVSSRHPFTPNIFILVFLVNCVLSSIILRYYLLISGFFCCVLLGTYFSIVFKENS